MSEDELEEVFKEKLKKLRLTKSREEFLVFLYSLNKNELIILREKFGIDLNNDPVLKEIGEEFDVVRKRIREIEKKALSKLRKPGPMNDDPDTE